MRWNGTIANMPAQEPIIAKTGVFALNSLKTVLGVMGMPFTSGRPMPPIFNGLKTHFVIKNLF